MQCAVGIHPAQRQRIAATVAVTALHAGIDAGLQITMQLALRKLDAETGQCLFVGGACCGVAGHAHLRGDVTRR
ncbi:hypothetical protein D3C72_1069220 [compost metagenome]